MLNQKVKDLINDQINKEMYSSYLYLNVGNYYAEQGLNGFSSWFRKQANEELEHAVKFIDYLHDQNENVQLLSIESPKHQFKDAKEPLVLTLEHEQYVTSLINGIYQAALDAHDYRTTHFLDWFIGEQTEEEKTAQDLLNKYDHFVTNAKALYQLDLELSKR